MPSVPEMTERVFALRDELEEQVVEPAAQELSSTWIAAAAALVPLLRELESVVDLDDQGRLRAGADTVDQVATHMAAFKEASDGLIRTTGKLWAGAATERAFRAGQQLAFANLNVDVIDERVADVLLSQRLTNAQHGIIKAGMEDMVAAVNAVGDRLDDYISRKVLQAMFEGLPVVNKTNPRGPSLMNALLDKGQLKPIEILSTTGQIVKRSIAQQAEAIARVEMAKVMERTHNTIAEQALGSAMVGINSNPLDSRTTAICKRASAQPAMTRQQWLASGLGLAPRLSPFHFCRSTMVWGLPEWFNQNERAP